MPTFERCDKSIETLAAELLKKFESHAPVVLAQVKIDFVFAFADRDEKTSRKLNDALKKNGVRALGITRKIPLKDRALGRGDAEIALDGDWWKEAQSDQQAALLDHELHHIAVKADKHGNIQYDDLGRPQLKLRLHDVEVGWFCAIAERHGIASMERIQARAIMDGIGQYFWPDMATTVQISSGGIKTKPMSMDAFAKSSAKRA